MDSPSLELIVAAAMELPEPSRAKFLKQACDGDERLRERAESVLARRLHDKQGPPRRTPQPDPHGRPFGAPYTSDTAAPGPPSTASPALREKPGTLIGRYKLLQQIGEGGFGVVFMAEQTEPVVRRVALKIIKLGMDTRHVVARFEAERQALAMMDHPAIAKVLDGGATDSGRPYFVMELVRGVPITSFCDQQKLPVRERLELFREVCAAVQHAHQKGIIHRDLKPSNILVTVADGRPLPKIIDFGIAKAMHFRLTEKTVFTEFRQLIGTPEYMSPEQAEVSGVDIDTRSDIFSLGVLLYELLTGVTPLDATKLRSAAYGEMQRLIREEEPAKPSTRLATLQSLPTAAANRRVDAARLQPLLRGDLDWIVMKCIDKDRARRYDSAAALSDDVRRHLAGEAVTASPPTASYRLRKLAWRHRRALAMASVVLVGLVAGLVLMTVGFIKARSDRDAAIAARSEAMAAGKRAAEERDAAERARAEAVAANQRLAEQTEHQKRVNQFLSRLFIMTDAHTPVDNAGTFEGIIAQGQELLGEDHAITDSVLASWVQALLTFDRPDRAVAAAEQLYNRALGRPDTDPLKAWSGALYARALNQAGKHNEALLHIRTFLEGPAAVSIQKQGHAPFVLDAFVSIVGSLPAGTPVKELSNTWPVVLKCAGETYDPASDKLQDIRCAYGVWLQETQRWTEAGPILEDVVRAARAHDRLSLPLPFRALNSLTLVYIIQKRNGEAKLVYRELLDLYKGKFGALSPLYARNFEGYLQWLLMIGEEELAETERRRLAIETSDVAPNSPHALRFGRARMLLEDGKNDEAANWAAALLNDLTAVDAPRPDALARGRFLVERILIVAQAKAGHTSEARRRVTALISALESAHGKQHDLAIRARAVVADVLDAEGDHAGALDLLEDLTTSALSSAPARESLATDLIRARMKIAEHAGDSARKSAAEAEAEKLGGVSPLNSWHDGLEGDDAGAFPSAWHQPSIAEEYGQIVVVVDQSAFEGKRCILVSGLSGVGAAMKARQGVRNVIRSFDAARFRGKHVRYTAAVRVEAGADDPESRAQLWLRVDRPNYAKPALFDNMFDRPIRSSPWATYQIQGLVESDAQEIVIGLMVFGEADAWLDDVRIEVLEDAVPPSAPPPAPAPAK